jgi:hypothetical protein
MTNCRDGFGRPVRGEADKKKADKVVRGKTTLFVMRFPRPAQKQQQQPAPA